MHSFFDNASLIDCRFRNASFAANFTYTHGQQEIQTIMNRIANDVVPQASFRAPVPDHDNLEISRLNCSSLNLNGTPCLFDSDLIRTIAYQSVIEAFVQLIQGTIGISSLFAENMDTPSRVATTVLMDTDDMAFAQHYLPTIQRFELGAILQTYGGSLSQGLTNAPTNGTRGLLARAIEELFLNYTLSLISDPYLQPNKTSPFAPSGETSVTGTEFHNVYMYSMSTLWLAYGLAIGSATLV